MESEMKTSIVAAISFQTNYWLVALYQYYTKIHLCW